MTVPYKKQLYRVFKNGKILKDIVSHFDEHIEDGVKMLKLYIKDGELVRNTPSLHEIREKTLINFKTLPDTFKSITQHMTINPEISPRLIKITEDLRKSIKSGA